MTLYRKHEFSIPEGMIYLDGNSLGPMPKAVKAAMETVQDQWQELLIKGWNQAGWYQQPRVLGDKLAPLIGAGPGTVMIGDTLSIKMSQALDAALKFRPDRKVVLSDTGNFPTDLYMAKALIEAKNQGHSLKLVAPEAVEDALDEQVAVLMLTQADYRTGRLHDMARLTAKAHEQGALVIWDLAHSAGAFPVDLAGCQADFAAGCTYKYLNAGPGAPAFIYVRPDLIDQCAPLLAGWMGHSDPFAFELEYQPAPGIERMRVGTPPVLQMAALEAALDLWETVDMQALAKASQSLSQRFIAQVQSLDLGLDLVSPLDPELRASQIAFAHDKAYPIMQALIDREVIGDFRAPNLLRFGVTPLYLNEADIDKAVSILSDVLTTQAWRSYPSSPGGSVT